VILSKVIAVSYGIYLKDIQLLFFKKKKVFQICDPKVQESRILVYIILFIGLGVLMLFTMFLQVNISFIYQVKIINFSIISEFSFCSIG